MDRWETEDDFDKDWWSLADIPPTSFSKPAPPISDNLKKARAKIHHSIYDMDIEEEQEDEEVEYCRPVRGRVIRQTETRPGTKCKGSNHRELTQRQIRQVVGLGYSNELIEHAFKNGSSEVTEKTPDLAELLFIPADQKYCDANEGNKSDSDSKGTPSTSRSRSPNSVKSCGKNSESSASPTSQRTPTRNNLRYSDSAESPRKSRYSINSPVDFPALQ